MKTAEEYFREHCIKNSLFFSQDDVDDIVEAIKLYANQKLDEACNEIEGNISLDFNQSQILSLKDKV